MKDVAVVGHRRTGIAKAMADVAPWELHAAYAVTTLGLACGMSGIR